MTGATGWKHFPGWKLQLVRSASWHAAFWGVCSTLRQPAPPPSPLSSSRPGFTPGQYDCSLLRGAVVFSDRTTTVSPTYAREVRRDPFTGAR